MQDLTRQLGSEAQSVRVFELESECKLAEERIAELESQLAAAPMLDAPGENCHLTMHLSTPSAPKNTGKTLVCFGVACQILLI